MPIGTTRKYTLRNGLPILLQILQEFLSARDKFRFYGFHVEGCYNIISHPVFVLFWYI
jgi:hypothetical protein